MKNPRQWYVYFLIYRKKVVYVGMSSNIPSRIATHFIDKKFTSIRWTLYGSKVEAAESEKRLILKFMPKYNSESYLTLKRQKNGMLKGYLPDTTLDLLQSLAIENDTDIDDMLRHPLIKSLYVYEKYQKPIK